jgi:hypothetical protein
MRHEATPKNENGGNAAGTIASPSENILNKRQKLEF